MPPGLRPALGDWAVRMTFIVPVDPDEPRPRPRVPSDADRPVIRERDAVLPDPFNGWALVDRVVAHMAPGRPIPVPSIHFPRPHRVHQHWRLGPNHVLPVAAGG
jgi:hypothetical protein